MTDSHSYPCFTLNADSRLTMHKFLVELTDANGEVEYYPVQSLTAERAIEITLETMPYSDGDWTATDIYKQFINN